MAVEETRDTVAGHLPYSGERIFPHVAAPSWPRLQYLQMCFIVFGFFSGVLQKVRSQLGIAVGEARVNICELGVAVGLPRHTIKECLLEGVSLEDMAQLEALVALFLEKTHDADRLLNRVAEVEIRSRSAIYLHMGVTFS